MVSDTCAPPRAADRMIGLNPDAPAALISLDDDDASGTICIPCIGIAGACCC